MAPPPGEGSTQIKAGAGAGDELRAQSGADRDEGPSARAGVGVEVASSEQRRRRRSTPGAEEAGDPAGAEGAEEPRRSGEVEPARSARRGGSRWSPRGGANVGDVPASALSSPTAWIRTETRSDALPTRMVAPSGGDAGSGEGEAGDDDGQIPPGSGDAEEVGDGVEAWCLLLLLGARRATAARIRRRKKRGRSPGAGDLGDELEGAEAQKTPGAGSGRIRPAATPQATMATNRSGRI